MLRALTIAAAVLACQIGAPALADDECWVSMTDWQPRAAVADLAAQQGGTLVRIRIDDGCYEVVATDGLGRPLKAKVNQATLEIIAIKNDGEDEQEKPDQKD